jgi:hypothetical protein
MWSGGLGLSAGVSLALEVRIAGQRFRRRRALPGSACSSGGAARSPTCPGTEAYRADTFMAKTDLVALTGRAFGPTVRPFC